MDCHEQEDHSHTPSRDATATSVYLLLIEHLLQVILGQGTLISLLTSSDRRVKQKRLFLESLNLDWNAQGSISSDLDIGTGNK